MDGKGRAADNIFIERFWRSLKYEEVYPKNYQSPREARLELAKYFDLYNYQRPHQSLGYQIPADLYFAKSWSQGSGLDCLPACEGLIIPTGRLRKQVSESAPIVVTSVSHAGSRSVKSILDTVSVFPRELTKNRL